MRWTAGEIAAHEANVRYVDAGAAVLDDGRWTETLSCLPGEPCAGGTDPLGRSVNVVRAPDGVHFCPAEGRAPRRDRHVPGLVERCVPLRVAMAQPVVLDLTTDRQSDQPQRARSLRAAGSSTSSRPRPTLMMPASSIERRSLLMVGRVVPASCARSSW